MTGKIYSRINEIPFGKTTDTRYDGCLVLEGGAFRGLYTSGVLDALMLNGINLQTVIGVSAGAMNGMNYISGQIGRNGAVNLRFRHDRHYVGLSPLLHDHGVIGFDYLMNEIDKTYPFDREAFYDPARKYVAVATNCYTGKAEYFDRDTCSDIMTACRASASMPYVSKMVPLGKSRYLDGGCSDKIPFHWALDHGYEKIVVIRTRPDDYRKKIHDNTFLPEHFYHHYPKFAEALKTSDARYNQCCDELLHLQKMGRIFLISPSETIPVSRLEGDMEKLGSLYQLGRKDGEAIIDDLLHYLIH